MRITRKQKRLIALGIGFLFIALGILQGVFKFELNKTIADPISYILLIGAASLLLGKDKADPKATQEDLPAPTEEGPTKDDKI